MIQVCDIVEYGLDSFGKNPQTWRVTHHLKRVEDSLDSWKPKHTGEEITKRVCLKFREEDRRKRKKQGLPHKRRYKLVYCLPEEATHVSLTSICGCQAPISECKKVGTANWDLDKIKEERDNAVGPFWLNMEMCMIDWEWE